MLRTRLLAAVAVAALGTAPALAQTARTDTSAAQAAPSSAARQNAQDRQEPAGNAGQETPAPSGTIIDVLRAQGNFSTLLEALERAELTDTLATRPAVSIFAPTDEAFAALSQEERDRLLDPAHAADLRERLLYHVIVADVAASQIEGTRGGVQTAAQAEVLLDGTGEAIRVDRARVIQAELDASNGAVFAIDQVLDPGRSAAAMGDSEPAVGIDEASDEAETPAQAPADEAVAQEAPAPTPPTLPPEESGSRAVQSPSPATRNPEAAPPAPGAAQARPSSGVTSTTRPAQGEIAPNGQAAATVTTVRSPPVANPTDGQVDDEEDPANPAPTPDR